MDDFSPRPQAPSLAAFDDVPEDNEEALIEDKVIASAFHHPGWAKVERMFQEEIDRLSLAPSDKLTAQEYKIKGVANRQAVTALINILGRITDAVRATEPADSEGGV